ncbi:MAG: SMC-Scp complex subunit ScpB [Chloroflexi bacterium]|nr:SMC-Scp complex subunit ScpB [Chloroflexota bacterium]MBU1749799.1 SMC-Scp complex subunit ScpB [Chloroflexota bacterium]
MTTPEELDQQVNLLESLLFVATGPADRAQLARTLDLEVDQLDPVITALAQRYTGRGLRVQRQGRTVQLVTAPEAAAYVERFLGLESSGKLSPAAVETLAIVAYRQPLTRAEIEAVRGVNSDGVLRTLGARGLVAEVDRLETPGRPIRYGVTPEFLQYFGLRDQEDLPLLPDGDEP